MAGRAWATDAAGGCTRLRPWRTRSASDRRARVSWQSTILVGGAIYSGPSALVDERVWARSDISELVVVHADGSRGPREVGRHQLTTPGPPNIRDEHYPARPAGALERKPKAWSVDERAFLAIAAGAALAGRRAAAGAVRFRRKLAEAARWPSCTAPRSSMAHCARRPTRGASATATWPRSSPTTTAHG